MLRWPVCRRYPVSTVISPPALPMRCSERAGSWRWGRPRALALAVAAGIALLGGGDPARAAALAAAIALMVGVIAIGGRFLGLANLAYFFSNSVVTGFKTGAALYIASTQLPKLIGLEGIGGNFFERLFHVATCCRTRRCHRLPSGHWRLRFSCCWNGRLPGRPTTLVVVAARSQRRGFFGLGRSASISWSHCRSACPPSALPAIHFADLREMIAHRVRLLPAGLWRDDLGGAQLCPEARIRDRSRARTDGTRRGQSGRGLVRGFPVAGGMSQSAVNDMGGARSPASLIVTSIAVGAHPAVLRRLVPRSARTGAGARSC